MKITYDPRYNIACIRLQEKSTEGETLRISDELNVDLTPDGKVYGIELLNAKVQLFSQDQGKLVLINEALGGVQEISL
ncbi:MAG: DUF2283 domain-containing protein [Thermodesulfobacteriota bacterium]